MLGFYETDDNKMYIISDKDTFSLNDRLTVAHEATHALQQYEFDIGGLLDELEDYDDRRMALRSLIEGDALISELLYMLTYFDEDEQAEVESNRGNQDLAAFRAAPVFIQNTITFPYTGGYQFAVYLYLKNNDFSSINLAYEALPASTEQIIHPEKYDAGEDPVEVSIPDFTELLGTGLGRDRQERDGGTVPEIVSGGWSGPRDGGDGGGGMGRGRVSAAGNAHLGCAGDLQRLGHGRGRN